MDKNSSISVSDAYRAMYLFLKEYWQRGNRTGEDDPIASLLSDVHFAQEDPTKTADPAQWSDWVNAVERVTK